MLTYTRGTWGETGKDESIHCSGRQMHIEQEIHLYQMREYGPLGLVEIYLAEEESWPLIFADSTWAYLVHVNFVDTGESVLVADLPSLLMLLKEVQPLLDIASAHEAHMIREEEHQWKALQVREKLGRSFKCDHFLP